MMPASAVQSSSSSMSKTATAGASVEPTPPGDLGAPTESFGGRDAAEEAREEMLAEEGATEGSRARDDSRRTAG
jgi:hypothetical protein